MESAPEIPLRMLFREQLFLWKEGNTVSHLKIIDQENMKALLLAGKQRNGGRRQLHSLPSSKHKDGPEHVTTD